jgi:hypothetical protein
MTPANPLRYCGCIERCMSKELLEILGAHDATEWWLKFLFWLSALLAPVMGIMGATVFFILVDFTTGVYAAYRCKEPIVARKMGNTLSKLLFYNLVVLTGFAFETFIVPKVPMMQIISGFIAITELRSIFENFNKIYGIDLMAFLKATIIKRKDISDAIEESKEKKDDKKSR